MADSDKNILITPNRGSTTADPKIEFVGGDNNPITLTVLDDGTLSFSGSSGQLFSVSDSLTGTIFSVNDVSGIPSIEVDDTGEVRLAEYAGNVLIGTNVDNGAKLQLMGTTYQHPLYIESAFSDKIKLKSTNTSVSGNGIDFFNSDDKLTGSLRTSWSSSNKYIELYQSFNTVASEVRSLRLKPGDHLKAVYANTEYNIFNDNYHPNADKLTNARAIALTGAVTGSANFDGTSNISITTTATADPTLTLTGDVTGSATFTNLGNATLTATVANDSHSHSNYLTTNGKAADSNLLDGLDLHTGVNNQANKVVRTDGNGYLNTGWINTISGATTGTSRIYASNDSYIRYVTNDTFRNNLGLWWSGNDGSGSGLDADLLDGQQPSALSVNYANYAGYLPPVYAGGYQPNPQTYFDHNIGLKVAMTGYPSVWSDTLWINGYSGGDVVNMCALHTIRNGTPRMWISTQSNRATSYGTAYEFWTAYNDGSGSGLDADLLDGLDSSSFWQKSGSWRGIHTDKTRVVGVSSGGGEVWFGYAGGKGNVIVDGEYYANEGNSKVWHAGNFNPSSYAPASSIGNGTLTITTSGSASGGGTFSANQSGNTTINITATDTNTTYNFSGSSFTSRNSGNINTIDNSTSNMVGYVNGSSAAGYSDGAAWVAAYSSSWVGQLFLNFRDGALATRGKNNGTWQGWRKVWDNTNDGSGSGLDADLLDGQHGSYYAPASHSHSYLPLSGGTVTGATSLRAGGTHLGNHEFASASGTSTGYSDAGIEIREGAYGGTANYSAPRLAFHWGGVVASNISIDTGGAILIRNNPGTSYENLRANNFYANGTNIVWNAGNDGSGSGLDADLLDGLQGSNYLRDDGWNTSPGQDANTQTAMRSDFTYANNAPHTGELIRFGASNYSLQLNAGYGSSGVGFSFRTNNGDGGAYNWNPWRTIWHSGNDGSGSTLDADTVDGLEGSSLLRSDADDTFSGTLTHSSQVALVPDNYGKGVFGKYSPTRYQHVWSMGTAYKTGASGTSYGNMYGLTWTHTNIGTGTNQAISGLSHQLQLRMNGVLYCAFGSGIWTSGNITAYSDRAVKTNLEVIPNALDKVMSINGYTYDRTDFEPDPETGIMPETRQAGVVAQEVEAILPEVVSGEEGNKAVAYGNMVALLIEAIKELKSEVNDLKAKLEEK